MDMTAKTRVAILGGGPASLTTAFLITSTPELRDRFDVTVYQMGFRVGGKGACGRGPDDRIEEHGLHILFGFYQNFFTIIRQCYEELGRDKSAPLATWREAFHPYVVGVEEDYFEGRWYPWLFAFPRGSGVPGSYGALPSPGEYAQYAVQVLIELLAGFRAAYRTTTCVYPTGKAWEDGKDPPIGGSSSPVSELAAELLEQALILANRVYERLEQHHSLLLTLLRVIRQLVWPFMHRLAKINEHTNRFWLGLDVFFAFTIGIIADGVLTPGGFAKIDDLDFRAWLLKHGAHQASMDHPLVRTIYDAAFSYEDGDPYRERVAAGSAVRALIRAAFTFKGSLYYKMHAGMGDAVFTPLYEVLKRRGVKFEFFHMVRSLDLSADKRNVERVRFTRQARLLDPSTPYNPLIDVKGLPSWPAGPLWDQLDPADRQPQYDFESYYSNVPPTNANEVSIEHGTHFDLLVFGIPIGAVPYVCAELVAENPRWQAMVQKVRSVQTVAFQTWMKRDLKSLGWPTPSPLLSLYVDPLNTWADMTQVLDKESWSPGNRPENISYFCGPQPGPVLAPTPFTPQGLAFEQSMADNAKDKALEFMKQAATGLFPRAGDPANPPCIDWNVLIDPEHRVGPARFDAQYWRSNSGPAERCTLALPGTNQFRIKADQTGFLNLVITGDWIENNFHLACMEGTFMSGILAARAVAHVDFPLIGEALNRE